MHNKSASCVILKKAFQIALLSFGLLFFLFPIEDAGTGGYMIAVPMVCRLILVAIVFPLCTGLCVLRTQKDICHIYEETLPRWGCGFFLFTGGLIGPLGIIPLTAYLTVDTIIPLLGLNDSVLIRIVLLTLLVALSHYMATSSEKKGSIAPAIAIGTFIICIAAAMFCLLKKVDANVPDGGNSSQIYLECHIAIFWALAPVFLRPHKNGENKSIKQLLREPAMRAYVLGGVITLISVAALLLISFQFPGLDGFTAAALLHIGKNGSATQIVAAIVTVVLGIFVMAACQKASTTWLQKADKKKIANPTLYKWAFPALSLMLALPVIGEFWLKIAEALLVSTYPVAAVLVIFYALIPKTEEPRKQYSLKYASISAVVFGSFMFAYHVLRNFGIDVPLLRGLYESMLLSKGHLTWLVVSVLLFVVGDTSYRKKEERKKEASKSRGTN